MKNEGGSPRRGSMARNIVHLGLGQVATTILTIVLNATMARRLGPAEFGLLYLVLSIASFTFVIVDWGHGPYIIRETARHPERAGNLFGSASAVRTVGALLGCVIAVTVTRLLGYDVRTCVLTGILILALLPQYLGLSFGWVFRAYERMDLDAILNIVLKVVAVVGSIACVALGGDLLQLVLVWGGAGCLTLMVGFFMYRRLNLPVLSATIATSRELLRDGASFLGISLAAAVEGYLNANILYKMASPEVVGWYGAAANIAGTLVAPASILVASVYPRWSKAAGDPAEFKRVFSLSFRPLFLVAVLGAVGTYLFADVAVGLIYTMRKFGPAADDLRAFAPVLVLMYVDMFLGMAILAAGRAGRLAGAKVVSVLLTTGLVFLLIPLCQARFGNGGLGLMFAMVISELWMLFAGGMILRTVFDGRMIFDVCRGLAAGVATIVLFRELPAFTPFLAIPLCVATFGALSWLVGAVNRADLDMLLMSVRKRSAVAP